MLSCWRRIYGYGRCLLVGEEYILILIHILVLVLVFVFLVLVLLLCCWCCLKLFKCALRLAAAAFFWAEKLHFLKNWYFLYCEKTIFCLKMIKNTTFELLDHHHELNQKKLILLKFFMLKTDSTMLKLWSIPFFSCIFWPFSTPCTFLNV